MGEIHSEVSLDFRPSGRAAKSTLMKRKRRHTPQTPAHVRKVQRSGRCDPGVRINKKSIEQNKVEDQTQIHRNMYFYTYFYTHFYTNVYISKQTYFYTNDSYTYNKSLISHIIYQNKFQIDHRVAY